MKASLQLKRGIWQVVISYKDEGDNFKTKWISTGLPERGNKKAAKEILERKVEEFEKEQKLAKEKIERRSKPKEIDRSEAAMPFVDYCMKYVDSIKGKVSKTVHRSYRSYKKRLNEYFGKRKLRVIDITTEEILGFYDYLKECGLKNVSIKNYNCVIRPALREARKNKLIPDNPYEFVPSLKRQRPNLSFYDKKEMAKFFEIIEGDKFELAYKMAAYYGFRRSELIGLRWQVIDFEHKLVSVNHKVLVVDKEVELSDTLKTETSNRTLPLLPAIEKLLLEKKSEIEDNKSFYGNTYDDRYLDYIFVDDDGNLIYPDRLSDNFRTIQKKNGLKRIRFHDLRHSCASIMLANGVQMKQIQDWLGHSNFATTADVYSHLDFSSKVQSGAIIANALDMGAKSNSQPATIVNEKDFLRNVRKNMLELGFTNVVDYFAYLDSLDNELDDSSELQ